MMKRRMVAAVRSLSGSGKNPGWFALNPKDFLKFINEINAANGVEIRKATIESDFVKTPERILGSNVYADYGVAIGAVRMEWPDGKVVTYEGIE